MTELIEDAIASYPEHAAAVGGSGGAPYDSASLSEIYAPRVRQLRDLRAEGFTHAEWRWDDERGHNRWFGAKP